MIAAEAPHVADWLAAWGQIGGAVGTVATLCVAIWLARRDNRWRRAEQADRDAAQARLITVELDYYYPGYVEGPKIVAKMVNSSSQPVHEAKVDLLRNIAKPHLRWRYDDDGDDPELKVWANVLNPGEKFRVGVEFFEPGSYRTTYVGGGSDVTITFTDANGFRWSRKNSEAPRRIVDQPSDGGVTAVTGFSDPGRPRKNEVVNGGRTLPRRRPRRRIRRFLGRWYIPGFVTVIFLSTIVQIILDNRPAADVIAWVLGTLGQLVCMWCFAFAANQWRLDPDHEHRFRVLLGQSSVAIAVAYVAQTIWGDAVVGLPVVVGLVAVATLRDAAEAVVLLGRVRGEQVVDMEDGEATVRRPAPQDAALLETDAPGSPAPGQPVGPEPLTNPAENLEPNTSHGILAPPVDGSDVAEHDG